MHPENESKLISIGPLLHDIRPRHESEAERDTLLARLEAILQSARDGIIVSDPAGNLLLWNPAGLAMHGYKDLADARRQLSDFTDTFALYVPDEGSKRQSGDAPLPLSDWPMSRLMRGESFTDYELLVRRFDTGSEWYASYSGALARDSNKDLHLLVLTVRDISERKRAEQAQRETLEALHTKSREVTSILESVTDAFFALDESWCFTYVNQEAARVLLRGRDELLNKNIWEEFPAALNSPFETHYRRAAGERVTTVFRAYYPDPLNAWYDVRAYPSPTGAGLSVYFRNINEERHREEEREHLLAEQQRLLIALAAVSARQKESLHRSEERFRLLVEGVQDYAIFMLNTDGTVATWNAGAQRFKGYTADEIIGQHFSRFYTEEDIAKRHPWAELEIATREGRYEEEGWRVRKDGTRFWTSVVITALRDEQGELRGFGKVTRDVTERRLLEKERAASEIVEQQRRFLKDILSSVTLGRLMLCESQDELPASVDLIATDNPIVLSKKTLRTVRTRIREVSIQCKLPEDRIQGLVTAASECAMNAVQHAGGGTARVYGNADAGRVQVWITDTGTGIDISNIPRATLESGYSTGGGGIGHGFSLMIVGSHRVYLLTGAGGTTVVLEQIRHAAEPAWLTLFG